MGACLSGSCAVSCAKPGIPDDRIIARVAAALSTFLDFESCIGSSLELLSRGKMHFRCQAVWQQAPEETENKYTWRSLQALSSLRRPGCRPFASTLQGFADTLNRRITVQGRNGLAAEQWRTS